MIPMFRNVQMVQVRKVLAPLPHHPPQIQFLLISFD